ncbi:hypothetical protein [Amycolatopsis sp. PS_44_ISF1]|uniref:hypothetical protein n=1 Tax=Amycolatopsis sp. PS_44_ISF1 TaxID=2974917 RepID=UPI0028DF5C97|nr:hypothetical protein [Amycolatopsis sp. PS_44_ISF1]MDT8910757.1 hypothetical protein [Amycolatopsis sp. PS_44_ISF1]
MSEFFVDADGLDTGRNGFGEKASEIESLAQLISSLGDPGRVAAAAGNDKNGTNFTQTHVKSVGEIHDGIKAWSRAVEGTKEAIGDMAGSFREADAGAFDMTTQLRDNFDQLRDGSGGSGGDGSNPPLQRTQSLRAERREVEPSKTAERGTLTHRMLGESVQPARFDGMVSAKRMEALPAEPGVPLMSAERGAPVEQRALTERMLGEPVQPARFDGMVSAKRMEALPAEPGVPLMPAERGVPAEQGTLTETMPGEPVQPSRPAEFVRSERAERIPAEPVEPRQFDGMVPAERMDALPADRGVAPTWDGEQAPLLPEVGSGEVAPLQPTQVWARADRAEPAPGVVTEGVTTKPVPTD